jgi:arsenate reductase
MDRKTFKLLFLCTANSARSILAEALLNASGEGRFRAYSAGSHPTGVVNPLAMAELTRLRIPTDGLRSKGWDEFAQPGAPEMDFVITVCDRAAGEVCPAWPGQPITAHWGVPDPAAVRGGEQARMQAFHEVAVLMKRRIDILRALPLESLDRIAIHKRVREIPAQ